jgi:hypothetical protein
LSSAVRRRISLSANGSGAATDEAPLQTFKGRLFQQDQSVPDIVTVGVGMSSQDFFNPVRQPDCPSTGLLRGFRWLALSHIDAVRLPPLRRLVTGVHFT